MALREYLLTEVALDHAEGHLTRREALRKLGLMGLTVAGASALLTACGADEPTGSPALSAPAAPTSPPTAGVAAAGYDVAAARARTTAVTFPGAAGELRGVLAPAGSPRGAVLVIHENRGLTDHIAAVAGRLAGDGYTALGIDLVSRAGGTSAVPDATAALAGLSEPDLLADLAAGLDELRRRAPGQALGALGFCFGGGMVWKLLAAGAPGLAAAVPFYGPVPDPVSFERSDAAVLGVFAELDARVNAGRDRAEAALTAADLAHELRVVPGVDHAFFNDTGPRFNLAAAQTTYPAVLDWFGQHLG
ncbi:MAG TPA: dienelactone hydrolase family protein [Mycobacteriales bacterium]|jgi:carboxymethylenebutenolidase|nr:dienelactone hydrolase family protein [Mycobacteriales bacterium]